MTSFNPETQEPSVPETLTTQPATLPRLRPMSFRRLLLPLVFQLFLILSIPSQAMYTHITGKTVILQTAPVDPYDFLRGYSQTLGYKISEPRTLQSLPGWETMPGSPVTCATQDQWCVNRSIPPGTPIYVVLETPKVLEEKGIPKPWQPIKVSTEAPKTLPDNQVVLRGRFEGWRVEYGLETYYMPEDQRDEMNRNIQETQWKTPEAFVVEVKVDRGGRGVPVSLWVRDHNYRF